MTIPDRLAAANAARRARQHIKTFAHRGQSRGNSPAVRRESRYTGDREERAWRTHNLFGVKEREARSRAVSEWNFAQKRKGQAWGPLGPSGQRFLDSMMGLRCFQTGRLDWSIRTIAEKLRMSIQTVCGYVKRLVACGLLVKVRRSAPVEDPVPGGPVVEQITNAYWFELPPEIAERVRQILGRHVKPADQEQHEADQADELQRMLDQLTAEELAALHAGDGSVLAKHLAALGRAVDRSQRAILAGRE